MLWGRVAMTLLTRQLVNGLSNKGVKELSQMLCCRTVTTLLTRQLVNDLSP